MISKRNFPVPTLVVSRCLGYDHVRYNGDIIHSHELELLKPYIHSIPVCPEVEIGLSVPRDPIRIIRERGHDRLVQPISLKDLTDEMIVFSNKFLDDLPGVDGFILKNKSPSSGIANVNIYRSIEDSCPIEKGAGFFGRIVLARFTNYPIEDEGRICNHKIWDHFLTRIFLLADLRKAELEGCIHALVRFHTENKLLLMVYNQKSLRILGNLVANCEYKPLNAVYHAYRSELLDGTLRAPRFQSEINVLLYVFKFLSKVLSASERAFFLDQVNQYQNRKGIITLASIRPILQAWIIREKTPDLLNQTWFVPYPDQLIENAGEDLIPGER